MILLGIDPGYDRLGWAVGELQPAGKVRVLDFGCITTSAKDTLFDRYQVLLQELTTLLETHQPTETAIEMLYFSKNTTTALKVSEARGIIISSCMQAGCEIFEYNPMTIKQAVTGSGTADKRAVTKMIQLQMQLPQKPQKILDDTMDALAILLTHATQRTMRKMTQ